MGAFSTFIYYGEAAIQRPEAPKRSIFFLYKFVPYKY